jgi:hypothetical protein
VSSTGARRDPILRRGSTATQVVRPAGTIYERLRGGVRVNGRQQRLLDPELAVEDLHERSNAVRRAAGARDDARGPLR